MTFSSYLKKLKNSLISDIYLLDLDQFSHDIAGFISDSTENKKLTTIFGNGGSASDAQHWAAELTCTYKNKKRKPYLAQALTTDTSIITAWANDFTFDTIFSRQIEALGDLNGVAIGLSTSGKSSNVLNGLVSAKEHGAKTILISGKLDVKYDFVDLPIEFQSEETAIIQTLTQIMYHSICDHLEP